MAKITQDQLPQAQAGADDVARIAAQFSEIPTENISPASEYQAPAKPENIAPAPEAPAPSPQPSEPAKPAPTEPEPPKPAEPEDDGETWPRNARDWQQLKRKNAAKIAEKETALKQAMEELTVLKSKTTDLAQLEEIKKQRDELDEKLKIVAFERHPKFREYDTKIDRVVAEAKTIVGKDMQEQLTKALTMPDGEARRAELAKITETLDDFSKAELVASVREIRRLNGERESEHAKYKDNLQKWQHDEEQKAKERKVEVLSAFDRTLAKLRQQPEHILLQPGDNPEMQKLTAEVEKNARYYFSGEDIRPDHAAELAVEAASAPLYRAKAISAAKRIAELEDTIAKLKPGTRTTTTVQPTTGATPKSTGRMDSDDDMLSRVRANWPH